MKKARLTMMVLVTSLSHWRSLRTRGFDSRPGHTGLTRSFSESRRIIAMGNVKVNSEKILDVDALVGLGDKIEAGKQEPQFVKPIPPPIRPIRQIHDSIEMPTPDNIEELLP